MKGKYISGKYVEIYIKKNNSSKNLLGIAISKKIAKSVKRNRIKRLIKENYRLLEKDLKVGNSIIILWKKNISIEEAIFKNIENDIWLYITLISGVILVVLGILYSKRSYFARKRRLKKDS